MIINLFPLSIFKGSIFLDKKYKEDLVNYILEDEKKGRPSTDNIPQGRSKNPAFLGDEMGDSYLHNRKIFEKLFIKITGEVKTYLVNLGFDTDKINLYYQRSWATVSREGQAINMHDHKQSHISFAYYLNFPEKSGNIEFSNDTKSNEIVNGSFNNPYFRSRIIKETNMSNAPIATIPVLEDEIYIFPSKIFHRTQRGTNNKPRISLSADIVITVKEDVKNTEHGVADITNWKKFEL